jgi:flavin reductase (DIM6/NTAB) family NADH-FMN oxidoreductase RutF
MKLDPSTVSSDAAYHWLAATIVPRPIAWVSTLNENGTANLAPFSFFTGVTSEPVTCLICVARNKQGEKKDTWRNVERTGEYVIHVVPDALGQQMNATSRSLPYGVDEFEVAGVTKAPSDLVAPPRVVESPVAMECRLDRIVPVGPPGDDTAIIIGQVLLWHVHDDVLVNGRIDLGRLDAIGRTAGAGYVRTRDRFDMVRPKS